MAVAAKEQEAKEEEEEEEEEVEENWNLSVISDCRFPTYPTL